MTQPFNTYPPDGGGTPGGTTGQVQYDNSGAFGGISEGSSGQVLTSNGAGVAPTFQAVSGANNTTTTVNGSTSGTLIWSQPFRGAGYKNVVIVLSSFNDAGSTITFSTAFLNTPAIIGNSTGLTIVTLSTTQIAIPATGGAVSGTITLVGI